MYQAAEPNEPEIACIPTNCATDPLSSYNVFSDAVSWDEPETMPPITLPLITPLCIEREIVDVSEDDETTPSKLILFFIVESIDDAIKTFQKTDIDILWFPELKKFITKIYNLLK